MRHSASLTSLAKIHHILKDNNKKCPDQLANEGQPNQVNRFNEPYSGDHVSCSILCIYCVIEYITNNGRTTLKC